MRISSKMWNSSQNYDVFAWNIDFKIHDLPENLNSCSSGLLNCSKWVQTYNIIGKILYIWLVCLIILFHNEKSIFYLSGETTNVAWSLLEMFWQHPEGASEVTVTTEPESLSPEPELNLDSVGDWVFVLLQDWATSRLCVIRPDHQ